MEEPYVCTASSNRLYRCPYNGKPVKECKASLPYKDGSCLSYHPERMISHRDGGREVIYETSGLSRKH